MNGIAAFYRNYIVMALTTGSQSLAVISVNLEGISDATQVVIFQITSTHLRAAFLCGILESASLTIAFSRFTCAVYVLCETNIERRIAPPAPPELPSRNYISNRHEQSFNLKLIGEVVGTEVERDL